MALAGLGATIVGFRRHVVLRMVVLALCMVSLGFLGAQLRTHAVKSPALAKQLGPVMVSGEVIEVDQLPNAWRITIKSPTIDRLAKEDTPAKVRLKISGKNDIPVAGDQIKILAMLLPLSPPVLPGAYDFQKHAYFQQLGATGYALGKLEITEKAESGYFFERLRHKIRERIEARGFEDRDTTTVLNALMAGEGKGISKPAWEAIRDSGIAHLLSISGFHITMIFGFLFFSLRALLAGWEALALRYPVKKVSAVIALAGTVFYVILISSPIPAQRTAMMLGVATLAILLDREALSLRLVAFTALLILFIQPESLTGPSFQMSFAAVIALIAFYEHTRNDWDEQKPRKGFIRAVLFYLGACMLTTVIATLATAPYTLYHFQHLPMLSGLIANMIAVPLSAFIVLPLGLIGCALIPLGLEAWAFDLAGYGVHLMLATAYETASWPYAVVEANAWPPAGIFFLTLAGLIFVIHLGVLRWIAVLPLLIGLWMVATAQRPDVMASANPGLYAVREPNRTIRISPGRAHGFEREQWQEREGSRGVTLLQGPGCDDQACLYQKHGVSVALVTDPVALIDDCKIADIIISAEPIQKDLCPHPRLLIDRWDLRNKGAHALYIHPDGTWKMENVAEKRGLRPWVFSDKPLNKK